MESCGVGVLNYVEWVYRIMCSGCMESCGISIWIMGLAPCHSVSMHSQDSVHPLHMIP